MLKTAICDLFGIKYPIIQGGMVYLGTAGLVSAVSNAGGLGIITAGSTATLDATLWGNDTDWAGAGTIITGNHNYWGDPDFLDPDAGDYHIGLGSAARDAGIDAGVLTDIDYQFRDAQPDLGADEYVASDCWARLNDGAIYTNVQAAVACQPVTGATLTWQPITPTVGQVVTFTAEAAGTGPITYTWAFGDGGTGVGAMMTHTYSQSDTYTVVLMVTNPCGEEILERGITVLAALVSYEVYLPLVLRQSP